MARRHPETEVIRVFAHVALGVGLLAFALRWAPGNAAEGSDALSPPQGPSDDAERGGWKNLDSFLAEHAVTTRDSPDSALSLLPVEDAPTLLTSSTPADTTSTPLGHKAQERRRRLLGDKADVVLRYAPLPSGVTPPVAPVTEAPKDPAKPEPPSPTQRRLTRLQTDRHLLEAIKNAITNLGAENPQNVSLEATGSGEPNGPPQAVRDE